ncbi:hypothetical protein D9M72_101920 [compost metagenome]
MELFGLEFPRFLCGPVCNLGADRVERGDRILFSKSADGEGRYAGFFLSACRQPTAQSRCWTNIEGICFYPLIGFEDASRNRRYVLAPHGGVDLEVEAGEEQLSKKLVPVFLRRPIFGCVARCDPVNENQLRHASPLGSTRLYKQPSAV